MVEKIKITLLDNTIKIIEVNNENIQTAFLENDIDSNLVRGIDKVGE